jgi:hypothetical protein
MSSMTPGPRPANSSSILLLPRTGPRALIVTGTLLGAGALAAILLLPSRRRLEELRNAAPAASPSLTDSVPAAGGAPAAQAADPR